MVFYKIVTFIVLTIILNVVDGQRLAQRPCNKNTYKEVDRMIARMSEFSNPENRFPETLEELKNRCENRRGLMKTIEDLNSRCMKGLVKRVLSVIIYSTKKQRKLLCRKTPTKKMIDLVSAGKCINNGTREIEKCTKQSIEHILGIKYAEDKMKMPLICCEFVRLKNCLISSATKSDICTEDHIQTLVKSSEQISSGAMNIACSDYNEETDKCEGLKAPQKRKGQRVPKSFLLPIIELFESFPEA